MLFFKEILFISLFFRIFFISLSTPRGQNFSGSFIQSGLQFQNNL